MLIISITERIYWFLIPSFEMLNCEWVVDYKGLFFILGEHSEDNIKKYLAI